MPARRALFAIPTVSFDGKRIVFSMRRSRDDDYHIYEVDADGRNLRQLTSGSMVADIGPAYLPNGKIVFSSTRDVKYCQCNRHISPNLFVMEADGRNILQIGRNNLGELHAAVMPDGRILYDRWEYVDRQFGPSYGLWTCNPDGTNHALYYGSNAWSPGAIIQTPRADSRAATTWCASSARVTIAPGVRCRSSIAGGAWTVRRRWFASGRPTQSELLDGIDNFSMDFVGRIDSFTQVSPKYEDPWPLADAAGRAVRASISSSPAASPGPIWPASRRRPADGDLSGRHLRQRDALARRGAGLLRSACRWPPAPAAGGSRADRPGEKRGLFLRPGRLSRQRDGAACRAARSSICGSSRRRLNGPGRQPCYGIDAAQAPAMNWNLTVNKRILGDVPVEPDGSAYFSAPPAVPLLPGPRRRQDDGPIDAQRHDR